MVEAEWSEEHTRIVCILFAEQVRCGNRSSTHLNNLGYKNVIEKFNEETGILYTRGQFKNKWAKLKLEYNAWKELLKQTGIGWDERKGTVDMNNDWWKMMRKKIPGCGKFKDKGIQNEDELKVMFEDLRNTGDDHFGASSGLIPQSPIDYRESMDSEPESDPEEITPTRKGKGKRSYCDDKEKTRRAKKNGGKWIEEQISKMVTLSERSAASVESLVNKDESSIKAVMTIVKECGAIPGTKQHFIATELFTKRAERDMFMTLDTPEDRFAWLTMKHYVKYGP